MRKLRLVAMTIISFVLGNFIHTEKYLQNNTYSNFLSRPGFRSCPI